MTRIEDRLTAAGRQLRSDVDESLSEAHVDDALAAGVASPSRGVRSRGLLALAAAVVVALVAVVGTVVVSDDEAGLVADEGETPTTADSGPTTSIPDVTADISVEVLGVGLGGEPGAIAFLGAADALADRWALAGPGDAAPEVDFGERVVLSFTVSAASRCMEPLGLDTDGSVVRPVFGPSRSPCVLGGVPGTFFLSVDRADLPATFDVVLDPDLVDDDGPFALFVDTSENFASFTPPRPPSGEVHFPDAPDLERPEAGREITFDGIGDVRLGQALPPSEVQVYEAREDCGYWGPGEPSHDGDEPLSGLVRIEDGSSTISTIDVRGNPRYRTASGVGVGTTLESLERVYGDDLVVDRNDPSGTPTDGLTARYSDVAAVRNGDRALTFLLSGDAVFGVKLSSADEWGDDEGCA